MKRHLGFTVLALTLLAFAPAATPTTPVTPGQSQDQTPAQLQKKKTSTGDDEQRRMEIVFVLDTTGSMGGMIAGAKQKIWAIANKLKSAEPTPEIHFGLVAFRDRGDAYVTRVTPLTDNLDDITRELFGFQAQGGGDTPESVNAALYGAVHEITWSDDPAVLRAIFLVGDAPPHMDYPDDVKYPESCRLAKKLGIVINALQCGGDPTTAQVWREIAQLTDGSYAAIMQDGGSIRIETTQDAEIVRITAALDATVVPYGPPDERANLARNRLFVGRMSAEGVADRSSFLDKAAGGTVIAGKGDLVLEVMSDRFPLASIEAEKLEPRLRNLFAEERDAYILRLVEDRRALQRQLAAAVKLREAEMAVKLEALKGRSDVLELNAFQVMETQAAKKGFRFKK